MTSPWSTTRACPTTSDSRSCSGDSRGPAPRWLSSIFPDRMRASRTSLSTTRCCTNWSWPPRARARRTNTERRVLRHATHFPRDLALAEESWESDHVAELDDHRRLELGDPAAAALAL